MPQFLVADTTPSIRIDSSSFTSTIILTIIFLLINFNNNYGGGGGGVFVDGRLCNSMIIRNFPRQLEKLRNCTVILGHLEIYLFDYIENSSVYGEYTFPQLTEIVDYLILFRLSKLTSVGRLFPNLRTIRGVKLWNDYALVVFRMPDLEEIGLYNLIHIGRGGVKVDYCDKLCYVNTIDWKRIGATKVSYFNTNPDICPGCNEECNGYCWDRYHCQRTDTDNCHQECIGCTKEMSPDHCGACKNWEDHGRCVKECPKGLYKHEHAKRCLTKLECSQLSTTTNTWWTFKDSCIQSCPIDYTEDRSLEGRCRYCGDKCIIYCHGGQLDTYTSLEDMKLCTHINGSLAIQLTDPIPMDILEIQLGRITEIRGYLKIGRSNTIKSLNFLKRLKIIRGEELENRAYSMFIYQNQNLQKLWDFRENFTFNILNGQVAFHNNPQLCLNEIEKFVNITGLRNKTDLDIFKYSNGEKSACNLKHLDVKIIENHPFNVTLIWDNFEVSGNETIIGYTVYYIEAKNNITIIESVCETDGGWSSVFVSNNTIQLVNLKPYTRYGYYIKSYSTHFKDLQTPIDYFRTRSDDPGPPIQFEAYAKDDTRIELVWKPPYFINGILSHYILTVFLEPDHFPTIEQRNYCQYPHVPGEQNRIPETIEFDEIVSRTDNDNYDNNNNNKNETNCTCAKQEVAIFQKDLMSLCQFNNTKDSCSNFLYHTSSDDDSDFNEIVTISNFIEQTTITATIKKQSLQQYNQTYREIIIKDPTATRYIVEGLKHYSLYIFFLQACNVKESDRDQCSAVEMATSRTMINKHADDIKQITVETDGDSNGDGALIKWTQPIDPNSYIVSYHIEYKRIDLEYSKAITECITQQQYEKNYYTYRIRNLVPGKYSIRVQAASLAGPGEFTQQRYFEIQSQTNHQIWINLTIILTILIIVIIVVTLIVYRWYKKKHLLDNIHLITSINPDYAGPIYEEDEWEIDRNDIEILHALGEGSFGTVHQGIIKSQNLPCAIKTITKTATLADRMEFLNEGAVMKSFNTAHHVVKLLGIVSRGQIPMVVMELMERGDLKSYLRRCREPSQNLTTNEIYRMAAEIADGMAYLSAKKFIHRDLAARNCMVAGDRTVKIGDFGMARDVYETDYYRKETVGLLPVRWMAPESLSDGVFSTDSDVWSYGVVLWEMATLAEQPYQGMSNEEVFNFIKTRGTLSRPNECSDLLYEVMSACWKWKPIQRPTFFQIVDKLSNHIGEGFRLVAFCHSREGQEYILNAGPRPYNPPAMSATIPETDTFLHYDTAEEEIGLYPPPPSTTTTTTINNRPNFPFTSQRYQQQRFIPELPPLSSTSSSSSGSVLSSKP